MEASNIQDRYFGISFTTSWTPIHGDNPLGEDPSTYVLEIEGLIDCYDNPIYETGGSQKIEAGKVSATLVRVGDAIEDEYSLFDVFDSSQYLLEIYEMTFLPHKRKLRAPVERLVHPDSLDGNVLVIDHVELKPPFRGARIGQGAILALMKAFGRGAFLLVAEPYPPQFGWMEEREPERYAALRLGAFTRDKAAASRKLRQYVADLGFQRLPRTDLMVRGGWDYFEPLPTLQELRLKR